jgi:hypothetical protein
MLRTRSLPHFLEYSKLGAEFTRGKTDYREQFDFATPHETQWKPGASDFLGEGYPGTGHGWNDVGRMVWVAGGVDGSPARVRVGGLAKVGYPRVPADGLAPK